MGEFWSSSLYQQNYFAADHRRVLEFFLIQTKLPRRRSSASFGVLPYTDRTTAPLIIGEFWSSFLYRRDYLAADHRRVYTNRTISPLIMGEFWSSSLYQQNYFAADHRRVLEFFLIRTGLSRR